MCAPGEPLAVTALSSVDARDRLSLRGVPHLRQSR